MWQLVLYFSQTESKNVGAPKNWASAFRKYERMTAKYPDRRYAIKYV